MTAALKAIVSVTVTTTIAASAGVAAVPAAAMPRATPTSRSDIVSVSGWATRAEGRRHTYPDPYGNVDGRYGYGCRGYGGYGGWAHGGYAEPYGFTGDAAPPEYGYDDGYGGDAYAY